PQTAEVDAAEPEQHAYKRAAGDAAKRWPQDRRRRRGGCAHSPATDGLSGAFGPPGPIRGGSAGPAGVHPKGKRQTSPARHSCHFGPRAASTGEECAGARVGGALRTEVLWISARARL